MVKLSRNPNLLTYHQAKHLVKQDGSAFQMSWLGHLLIWMEHVVAVPEHRVDPTRPLCPFVPPAIQKDLIFFKCIRKERNKKELVREMLETMDQFLAMSPTVSEKDYFLKAILVVFPELDIPELLKDVRVELKPTFLRNGITCGEFYPSNSDVSIRNNQFPVAKSPIPLIAIRYLSKHDEVFLRDESDLYGIFRAQMGASGQ